VFSGLVEATGVLRGVVPKGPGYRLEIACPLGALELGESIAVNGACLTVAALIPDGFAADVSLETVEKTTLGRLSAGSAVNLERSLALGQRLGGHLVSGHVDGLAVVMARESVGEALRVELAIAHELRRYVAKKGSVALDGVSLTVNALTPVGFEIMLIPHTLAVTNLNDLQLGRELNFEVDLLARYVIQYLEAAERPADAPEALSLLRTRASENATLAASLTRAGIL
jgi:riboflavin synthase